MLEAKQGWAWLVLGWGTAWEHQMPQDFYPDDRVFPFESGSFQGFSLMSSQGV